MPRLSLLLALCAAAVGPSLALLRPAVRAPVPSSVRPAGGRLPAVSRLPPLLASGGDDGAATLDELAARDKVPFELRGFSLGWVFLGVGVALTASCLGQYFTNLNASSADASGGLGALGLVYSIPITLIGLSLKYAELSPVPVDKDDAGERAFEAKATENLRKVLDDVTRHRYGDDAHMDTALRALGLYNEEYPRLLKIGLAAEANGELAFRLTFQSRNTPFKTWNSPEKLAKYRSFFGPGIAEARVDKVDSEQRILALTLVTGEPKPAVEEAAPAATEAAAAPAVEAAAAAAPEEAAGPAGEA